MGKPNSDVNATMTRRTVMVMAGQVGLVGILASRLVWLQGFSRNDLRARADGNRIQLVAVLPRRGLIVDRNDVVLAASNRDLQLFVVPERTRSIKESIESARNFVDIPENQEQRILKLAKKSGDYQPVRIASHLDWDTLSKLSIRLHDMPELELAEGQIRYYPFGELTAHTVGYVSPVSEKEREQSRDPMLQQPDYQIGKTAIERVYELSLRGKGGAREVEVNAVGRQIKQISLTPADAGEALKLGLDIRIQQFLHEEFANYRRASGVLLDVHSGEVIGALSKPAFDANMFSEGLDSDQWGLLSGHPDTPQTNKVISGQYAPGSTYKIITLLAGLERNIAQKLTTTCRGVYELGRGKFHCWKSGGHGSVNAAQGFRWSCDVWYYTLAHAIGIEAMGSIARELGLGSPTGIDLTGELPGLVPSQEWRLKRFGEPWQGGETLINAIGQGFVLATPLQLAQMVARVATGRRVKAGMLMKDRKENTKFPILNIKTQHLRYVRQLMYDVVNARDGTGRTARIAEPEMAVAGKTGTSQVRRIKKSERASGVLGNETLDWLLRDHSLFVAFAPAHRPRWSVAVVVEHAGSGSRVAAPIAGRLLKFVQTLYPEDKTDQARL